VFFRNKEGQIRKVGEMCRKMGVRRHFIPNLWHFLGVLWDVTQFWGGPTGVVLKNKRPKKGCFFQSIAGFGIVFGG
jgi:hypothetical protein